MRRRFGKVITELADKDEKIYLVVGDIGFRIFDDFREQHPERFINGPPQAPKIPNEVWINQPNNIIQCTTVLQ